MSVNLLVVEDNDIEVEILRRALRALHVSGDILHARDGREALALLNKQRSTSRVIAHPFLVLLDINMPGMNGHEFLARLRATPDLAQTRVVVLTTSDDPKDVARAYAHQAAGYLVKPSKRSAVQDQLRSLLTFWDTCTHPAQDLA